MRKLSGIRLITTLLFSINLILRSQVYEYMIAFTIMLTIYDIAALFKPKEGPSTINEIIHFTLATTIIIFTIINSIYGPTLLLTITLIVAIFNLATTVIYYHRDFAKKISILWFKTISISIIVAIASIYPMWKVSNYKVVPDDQVRLILGYMQPEQISADSYDSAIINCNTEVLTIKEGVWYMEFTTTSLGYDRNVDSPVPNRTEESSAIAYSLHDELCLNN